MKKNLILIISVFVLFITSVYATPGELISSSITSCNGNTYGNHDEDKHWHTALKNSDGSYNANGDSLGINNPCIQEKITVTLSSCIDGDTAKFIIDEKIQSTRFLAIDTPESTNQQELWGKEASDFTCNILSNTKKIELEFDSNSDKYDKYNRLLAWIWVDNNLLQDQIIKEGLGEVAYLYNDYKYTTQLLDSQEIAKSNNIGIWGTYKDEPNYIFIVIVTILFLIYIKYFSNIKNKNTLIKKILKQIK